MDGNTRVRLVLEKASEGDKESARRIAQACAMRTYNMADSDYTDRLTDAWAVCKVGCAQQSLKN